MHFSRTFRHCPSEHLLSFFNFPFSIGLLVTHLQREKTNLGVTFIRPDDVIVRGVGFFLDFVKTNKPVLLSRLSYEMLNLVCLIYGHL